MVTKFKYLICNFCLSLLLLTASSATAEQPIQFVETTGRAVITDENSINNARRNALEDAIFLAAIHGGAKINGFSSIDKETNRTDHFTLTPAGKLLDYDILEESIDGEHYKTTIRAAVGELTAAECSTRSQAKIVKFGAQFDFSSQVPAWLRQAAKDVETDIGELLQNHPNAILTEVSPTKLQINKLVSIDDTFDYTALTRGRVRVKSGDFALVPSISMQVTKSKKNIETEIFLFVTVVSQIKLSINSGLEKHVLELMDKVQCIPLTGVIKLREGKLIVDLGETHGVTTNSLAVSSGTTTAYSLLHVTEVFENQSTLEPLNSSLEKTSLIGKTINFMETYQ